METTTTVDTSTPKSIIRTNKEHNLDALLKLLKKNNIGINLLVARDPSEDAIKRIKKNFIPSISTHLEIRASYDEARKVLESSEEFRKHVDKILGIV